jgi:hypothetical protein
MKIKLLAAAAVTLGVLTVSSSAQAWTMNLSQNTVCVNGTSKATFTLANSTETQTMTVHNSNHTDLVPVGKTVAGKSSFTTVAVNTPYTLTIQVNWPGDKTLRTFTVTAKGQTCQTTTTTVKPTTTTTQHVTTTTAKVTTTTTAPLRTTTTLLKTTTTTAPHVTTSTTSSSTTLPTTTSTTTPLVSTTPTTYQSSKGFLANTGFDLGDWLITGIMLIVVGYLLTRFFREDEDR